MSKQTVNRFIYELVKNEGGWNHPIPETTILFLGHRAGYSWEKLRSAISYLKTYGFGRCIMRENNIPRPSPFDHDIVAYDIILKEKKLIVPP